MIKPERGVVNGSRIDRGTSKTIGTLYEMVYWGLSEKSHPIFPREIDTAPRGDRTAQNRHVVSRWIFGTL